MTEFWIGFALGFLAPVVIALVLVEVSYRSAGNKDLRQ